MRIFLGGFYLVAGAVKSLDPGKFAEAVANYRILPHDLINLVAITLPWIEVVAGLFLIAGIWFKASAWLINAMTVVFIAAIASAVARGLSIECGCFGTVGGREVGFNAIAEDVGFARVRPVASLEGGQEVKAMHCRPIPASTEAVKKLESPAISLLAVEPPVKGVSISRPGCLTWQRC